MANSKPVSISQLAMGAAATSSTDDCLVMAVAMGYKLEIHQRFVRSLRDTGFRGDVIVGLDEVSANNSAIMALMRKHNVQVEVPARNPSIPAEMRAAKFVRYWLYKHWASRKSYRLVLGLDFRDVYFQADPFAGVSLTGEWLRFYEEVFPPNMQDSYYTYAWVKECWGEEEAQKMAKAVVICSGGTMATPEGMAHYTDTMVASMRDPPREVCLDHDQRYHNYLFYTGRFKRVRLLRAGFSEFYNLGYLARDSNVRRPDRHWALDEKTVTVDGELRVLNEDGRPAAVLHQFDRFPALKTYAAAKWENANS